MRDGGDDGDGDVGGGVSRKSEYGIENPMQSREYWWREQYGPGSLNRL